MNGYGRPRPRPQSQRPPRASGHARAPKTNARRVAQEALTRIDEGGYANLVVPELLEQSDLDQRDRAFVTDLVYGTVRRRRSVDWLVMNHVEREPEETVLRVLHLGAYQLAFGRVANHAAVAETVDLAPSFARGFTNAVLRNVARQLDAGFSWPDLATELSYPDWIVDRLYTDLGPDDAIDALRFMNEAPAVTTRDDGYVQDTASQWVVDLLDPQPGERILDVCAAPGGKATLIAQRGATVVANDVRPHRIGLIAENVDRLSLADSVLPMASDATSAAFVDESFDRVLLDAPCSGLGVLHRRPDARWRVSDSDVRDLVALQRRLLIASLPLVRRGGVLLFSACTLTHAESAAHDEWMAREHPEFVPAVPADAARWDQLARGFRLLPQTHSTDGMVAFRYRRAT
jgi:16S rRNA (cytosine967-C5)-methyltransferase